MACTIIDKNPLADNCVRLVTFSHPFLIINLLTKCIQKQEQRFIYSFKNRYVYIVFSCHPFVMKNIMEHIQSLFSVVQKAQRSEVQDAQMPELKY